MVVDSVHPPARHVVIEISITLRTVLDLDASIIAIFRIVQV
jgi:hypothetical protein